ncbi:MAG: hypothetical protein JWR33_470 [Naasia sp.]|uniref:hypothetical protein n=1 Tax=Naasia sp. TaxID=2546198 RepID=UPI002619C885|nr:hypothetical protein [Naasia sp.]MCU1569729.1 hypothetical protein [Naasia sp.]
MSIEAGGPPGADGPPAQAAPPGRSVPTHAAGVQLLGELAGSGYREPPSLVRRGDGQTLQLTPLLYQVMEAIDGVRTTDEIAGTVSSATSRSVTGADIEKLIAAQLLPLGLLQRPDGTEPEVKRANPLLRMRFRIAVTDPERTRRLTAPFARLFTPFVAVPVLLAFLAICWWLLFDKGLGSATHQAFEKPGLLLLVFLVTLLSAGFHEFGHAAASTRGGAAPGTMGAGLYLVWPAFYTDVTDSYRLGRVGRLRTDAGGLYFNAIVSVVIVLLWLATRYDALLLIVATQILQMLRQLTPIVRFDGYHLLADATGVPDLFQRIRPTLRGLLPWHWGDQESKVLKPGARAVISLWVLLVVPMLLGSLLLMVLAFPRVLGTAWASIVEQQQHLSTAWSTGDVGGVAARALGIVAIAIPVAGLVYILLRVLRQTVTSAWQSTRDRPVRRGLAGGAAVAVLAALAFVWWPDGQAYRPVQAYESGTVLDAVRAVAPMAGQLRAGAQDDTVVLWPADAALPTADSPALSLLLVPRNPGAAPAPVGRPSPAAGEDTGSGTDPPAWVFPFDRPNAPDGDGSQALAVNTTDGSVVYDVAFALVWADGGTVDTTNEAYAFASCSGCAAVAVGFQVVLVVGQADVVVPQNLAEAVNYNCVDCVAFALAQQLVLTVTGPLSEGSMTDLAGLFEELAEFGRNIRDVPLSEIQARLSDIRDRMAAVIQADPAAVPAVDPAATPTPVPSVAGSSTPGPSPAAPGSATPDPAGTPDPNGSQPAGPDPAEPSVPVTPAASPPATPVPSPTPSAVAPPTPTPSATSAP